MSDDPTKYQRGRLSERPPSTQVLPSGPALDFTVDDNNVMVGVDREGKPYLAQLPMLTADELALLHEAIEARMNELAGARVDAAAIGPNPLIEIIDHKGRILQSLDTAVQEARGSLR